MKKILTFLVLFVVLVSCSTDEKKSQEEKLANQEESASLKSYTSYNGKTSSFIKTDTINLFTANDSVVLKEKMYIITDFNDEIEAAKDGYNETKAPEDLKADFATYKLNFINKKAYVVDLVFWNEDTKLPISVIPYSTEPVYDWTIAKCPQGWSGGNSYGSEESIKTALYNQMMKSLMSGDCIQFQVVKGTFTVKICHKKC